MTTAHKLKAWLVEDEYRTVVAAETVEEAIAFMLAEGLDREDLYDEPQAMDDDTVVPAGEMPAATIAALLNDVAEHGTAPCVIASTLE